MQRTYSYLSELIRTAYYKKYPNDNSNYTERHIAEMIASEVALAAKMDAYEQSRLGESTFSNDQFITTYFGLTLSTGENGNKYVAMPNTPAGLPQGREIAYVGFSGNNSVQVFPMRNKDRFMQSFAKTPKWMALYYVENGNIVFQNLPPLLTSSVDLKLVGAVPAGELVNQVLNIPKEMEALIFDKIMLKLNSIRQVLPDEVNDNVSK